MRYLITVDVTSDTPLTAMFIMDALRLHAANERVDIEARYVQVEVKE